MRTFRVIPVLLIHESGLVKSYRFKKYKYVGDPINAVRIFNDKEVDEICILDISATKRSSGPDFERVSHIVSEAFMPVAYGGGITSLMQAERLFYNGVEKLILNYSCFSNPSLITEIAKRYGSQAVVVSIDYKSGWLKTPYIYILNGTKRVRKTPTELAKEMESRGAGEVFLNSIERDGTYLGYDVETIKAVSNLVNIPVIACGGAGDISDFKIALNAGASAVAAGSMFVFQRPHNAVLISYPSREQLHKLLNSS